MRSLVVFAVLFTTAAPSQDVQTALAGSVQGVVLDSQHNPVPDAVVFGLPEGDMTHQIRGTTGLTGAFTLKGVPPGRIYIDAYKESAGYPYGFFAFFKTKDDRTPVNVAVQPGQVTKNIVIQLGSKAAYIRIDLSDDHGAAVGAAQLVFTRDDVRGVYKRTIHNDELCMVPPVPFRLTVEATGYESWHYGQERSQDKNGLIALKPGQTLRIQVHLARSNGQTK
jgi:hypothetical protein